MKQLAAFEFLIAGSTWLLTYAVHSLVSYGMALVAGRTIVRAPRARSALYRAAFIMPLVTATMVCAGVPAFAPIADVNIADMARHRSTARPAQVFVTQRVRLTNGGPPSITSFATDSIALNIAFAATVIAILTALLGLSRLVRRYRAFRGRLGSRSGVAVNPGGVPAAYRLTASPSLGAPVALGLHEICVPAAFGQLAAEEQRSVLAHEAAHLARRDPVWFAVSDVLVALFPWQPLARVLSREARRTAEFCCDDVVIESVGHGRALVRSLATFAAGMDPAETAFAASCGGSPLEERAHRLLSPAAGPHRTGLWAVVLALVLLAAFVSVAPAVSTRSRPETLRTDETRMRRVLIEEVDTAR